MIYRDRSVVEMDQDFYQHTIYAITYYSFRMFKLLLKFCILKKKTLKKLLLFLVFVDDHLSRS